MVGEPDNLKTPSGIEIDRLYMDRDQYQQDEVRLGSPGEFPFTRGIQKTMYRGRIWTMRQYAGFGTSEESNKRYKWLLEQGQTGLSVALDLPSQIGYDSDDPDAEEEVGRVGCAIDTLADMEQLFDGIPLERVSTSFTVNGTAAIMLAMYFAVAEKQGVPLNEVRGTMQNDILKEYVARGTWIFPPDPSVRLIVDTIEYCVNEAPKFNPVSIAGAHFRDAGASALQELAYTLADGITYVEACLDRGMEINSLGRILSFFFYTHQSDFFEEIAKYRAGRRLWAKIMKERYGATDPRAMKFRVGCVCGGSSLTAEQPMNNVVRVAYEALASVLGGVQSIFTCAWDEAYTIPSEQTAELALRTQQILAHETGVTKTVDPLGGSYFVEKLTDEFERRTLEVIQDIEGSGGMIEAIERGEIQAQIAARAYEEQRKTDSGERVVVGVNKYRHDETPSIEIYRVDESSVRNQQERLSAVRNSRDQQSVENALTDLRRAASVSGVNLMPKLIYCVKSYCTVGEITNVLKEVWGEWKEPAML